VAHGRRPRRRSPATTIAVAILVIIAVLAIIAGILYLAEPAKSLPSILGTITQPPSLASAHRTLRGWSALAVGVICLAAAWVVSRMARPSRR
jgi:uncharacterized membrane protein HdeD (DUF308 family)